MELDWLKKWNIYSPDKIAIKDGDTNREYNYRDFYKQTLQTSIYLNEKFQILEGDRVAVLSTNELEYLFLFFALQRLGAILVPVNFRLTEREVSHIISDSAPKLLLYQSEFIGISENLKNQCATYFIGVDDNGSIVGLTNEEIIGCVEKFVSIADTIGASIIGIQIIHVNNRSIIKLGVKIKKINDNYLVEFGDKY